MALLLRATALSFAMACGGPPLPPETASLDEVPSLEGTREEGTTLSVLGTADLHGHLERLPLLAGYVNAVREQGPTVLVDAGDMWQGTLASNRSEGRPVVAAYAALGYDGAAIGNHEFDYGPVGPSATCTEDGHEPRGALLARAAEATFPILAANLRQNGAPIDWPGVTPSVHFERGGVQVGIIGVTTEETLSTTIASNVNDLEVEALLSAVSREAQSLRSEGVQVVVVAAHAGGECAGMDERDAADGTGASQGHNPDDLSECDEESEIFRLANALPPGLVNVIVAGHTHKAIAHRVNGIAIISSWSLGRAFGRVDVRVDGEQVETTIHRTTSLCEGEVCAYAGVSVRPDAAMTELIAPAMAAAATQLGQALGPTLTSDFTRNYDGESSAGNLLADAVAAVRPEADAALLNAGGVRANFPAGELTYGDLYEVFPFDNRFANVRLSAGQLGAILARNARSEGGSLILGKIRAEVDCEGVTLRDGDGAVIEASRTLVVATSDYLATTPIFEGLAEGAVQILDEGLMREEIANHLRAMGERTLDPSAFLVEGAPRIALPSARPLACEGE